MPKTLIVGSQETGGTGILPVYGIHRQDAYASSAVSWIMKSDGKRSRLRLTARFRLLVGIPSRRYL